MSDLVDTSTIAPSGKAELAAKITTLEAELLEQARIVGAGGERELALLAKVDRLEAEVARLRGVICDANDNCPQCLGDGEYPFGRGDSTVPCEFCEITRAALGEQP